MQASLFFLLTPAPENGAHYLATSDHAAIKMTAKRMRLAAVSRRDVYFSAFFTVPKVELSSVPSPCTTVMIATEMPAAMRPYSIAVAPNFVGAETFD